MQLMKKKPAKESPQTALAALMSSALLLPAYQPSQADTPPERAEISFRYAKYQEDPISAQNIFGSSAKDRYDIDVGQFNFTTPVNDRWSVGLTGQWEFMSGASPWFSTADSSGNQQVIMSGASIEDKRSEYGVEARYYSEKGTFGVSYVNSSEDDYQSDAVGVDGTLNSANGMRTYSFAFSASDDHLSPTQGVFPTSTAKADKRSYSGWLGISQIIDQHSIFRLGMGFTQRSGYLTDPYKYRDNRPDKREELVLSGGYKYFFNDQNAALHLDYRYFSDSWDIVSHTTELAWVQNFGEGTQLAPFVRGYDQSKASFYSNVVNHSGQYFSDDHRLSSFGSFSYGLRWKQRLGDWDISATAERYESGSSFYRHSQPNSAALVDFWSYSVGLTYKL